jgi:hypothetical protein
VEPPEKIFYNTRLREKFESSVRGWVHVRARARGAAPAVVPAHRRKAAQVGPGATAYGGRRAVSSVLFGHEELTAKR